MATSIDIPPKPGEVVRVRSRRYLVEEVEPAPAPGEQKPPDSRTYESGEQGKNLNLPKLHKEEVAKCQEKCDLGPTNIEWPETWNPFWLMSNSNDFTRAGVACYPDPSTNPLSPKKATRTDGCGDDIKNTAIIYEKM